MTDGALLTLREVVVDFDGFKAVDGVSLSIDKGELRFLIGPNGAGKTSLVDVITGLTKPSEGEITFDGQSLAGVSAAKRVRAGIGRSFQTPTVFESLTVVENLDLAETYRFGIGRMLRRRRGISDGVATTLERIGLGDQSSRPAAVLSHGQKQWLEIGMLLVQQPKLVLLDEPVAGMSGSERQATGELLEELAEDHTVVVIEHDMAFLRRFARSVTVLHEGRILSEGSVDYVQGDPKVREVYLGRSRDERSGAVAEEATT
ncbi:MAG: urea ABC transporter ATP-binding protein UrtD [Ilumatobacteraceae bacterium]